MDDDRHVRFRGTIKMKSAHWTDFAESLFELVSCHSLQPSDKVYGYAVLRTLRAQCYFPFKMEDNPDRNLLRERRP
jgi:hypothetical protein